MSSNLRWRKREAWGVRGSLFILKQYCYKILIKTTTIIECENRAHPTRITLQLEMLDLQGLPVPPTLNLPKRLQPQHAQIPTRCVEPRTGAPAPGMDTAFGFRGSGTSVPITRLIQEPCTQI
jgi:hypothetical protein